MISNAIEDRDMGWAALKKMLVSYNGTSYTKVGLPEEKKPADVPGAHSESAYDLAQIAVVHEIGAPSRNIPMRSFVRSTTDKCKRNIDFMLTKEAEKITAGLSTPEKSLALIGEYLAGQMKLTIQERIPPPLKEQTIRKKTVNNKRGDVPLIDSAQLIQSITHVEVMA